MIFPGPWRLNAQWKVWVELPRLSVHWGEVKVAQVMSPGIAAARIGVVARCSRVGVVAVGGGGGG